MHEKIKIDALKGNTRQVMEAYSQLEKEPGYDPENDYILSMLMLVHVQSDKPSMAVEIFKQFYSLPGMKFDSGKNRVKIVLPLNILMQAYGKMKDIDSVLQVFRCIEEEGLAPDSNSCVAVIRVFLNCGEYENALKVIKEFLSSSLFPETLNDERRVAINDVVYRDLALAFQSKSAPETENENLNMILEASRKDLNENAYRKVVNAILMHYSEEGKDQELEDLFKQVFFSTLSEKTRRNELHPNASTLQIMCSHFAHKRDIGKLRVYLNLHLTDFPELRPSKSYVSTIMKALGATKNYDLLNAVFKEFFSPKSDEFEDDEMHVPRLEASTEEYNLVIRALASNGEVDRMNAMVKEMKKRNIARSPTTHVYIMQGHIMAGNTSKFLKLFNKRMGSPHSEDFIHPDMESFLFLLSTIGASGQVDLLQPVLEVMAKYGIRIDANVHNRVLRGLADKSPQMALDYFLRQFKESQRLGGGKVGSAAGESSPSESSADGDSETPRFLRPVRPNSLTYIHLMLPFAQMGDYAMCQNILEAFFSDGYTSAQDPDRVYLYNRVVASHLVARRYQEAYFRWVEFFDAPYDEFYLPESDPIQRNAKTLGGGNISGSASAAILMGGNMRGAMGSTRSGQTSTSTHPKVAANATSFSYLQFIYKALSKSPQEHIIQNYRRQHELNRIPKDDYLLFEKARKEHLNAAESEHRSISDQYFS